MSIFLGELAWSMSSVENVMPLFFAFVCVYLCYVLCVLLTFIFHFGKVVFMSKICVGSRLSKGIRWEFKALSFYSFSVLWIKVKNQTCP